MHIGRLLFVAILASCAGSKTPATAGTIENTVDTKGEPASEATRSDGRTTLSITSLMPAHGDAQGGSYVVIKGAGFIKDGPRLVKVYFANRQGTVVRFASDTELIVAAPGGTPGETVDVVLQFDPGGTFKLPRAVTFVDTP